MTNLNLTLKNNAFANSEDTTKTIHTIKEAICNYYEVPMTVFELKKRLREIVRAKQICAYLIKITLPKMVLRNIGKELNYTHCDVIYALKMVKAQIEVSSESRIDIVKIINIIKNKDSLINFNNFEDTRYINLDSCTSIKLKNKKAIIFTGFNTDDLSNFIENNPILKNRQIKNHIKTNIFLLEN